MVRDEIHILLVDNYDSFTFNLVHLLAKEPGVRLEVKRNDDSFIDEIENGNYDGVVIGPGPGSPEDEKYFGANKKIILNFGTQGLPVLGVCLGFQGIYHCFGGKLKIASLPMHGKLSELNIKKHGIILKGVPNKVTVMRYHSIMADIEQKVPDSLDLMAYSGSGKSQEMNGPELMALEHKEHSIYGVQFHPESFATECGSLMVRNFLTKCKERY